MHDTASGWSLRGAAMVTLVALGVSPGVGADELRGRSPWRPPPCQGQVVDPPALPEFILGVQAGSRSTTLMPELGLTWSRTYIKWSTIQPSVDDPELSFEETGVRPEIIEDYIAAGNWTSTDNLHRSLIQAGLDPFPVVGAGWYHSYPDLDGQPATPDALGTDAYLAQLYRHTRAVVERYDGDGYLDADGIVIKTWQIENELNQAWLTCLWGWRLPAFGEGLTSVWYDFNFVTDLLSTLNQAVHDADPEAITVTNLHTDVSEDINHMFRLPSWQEAAGLWRESVDVMGFDAYPNYYVAQPIRGDLVGERAALIREQTCGRNVIAMEVGYPAGPAELGFSEESQAAFLEEALTSLVAAGGSGYFYFKLDSAYSHTVEITEADKRAYQTLGYLYDQGRVLALTAWALANLEYIDEHMLDVLQAVEPYWGLVDSDGNHKPSFEVMQDLAEAIYGSGARLGTP